MEDMGGQWVDGRWSRMIGRLPNRANPLSERKRVKDENDG